MGWKNTRRKMIKIINCSGKIKANQEHQNISKHNCMSWYHELISWKFSRYGVAKWARALPTSKSVVITTMCELTVVGEVEVDDIEEEGREISMWLPLQSYSYYISVVSSDYIVLHMDLLFPRKQCTTLKRTSKVIIVL